MHTLWRKLRGDPEHGFTLIEIMVVIVVLGIIAGITYSIGVPKWRERTYYTKSNAELSTIGNALKLYAIKYNSYPDDVSRGLPNGIEEFVTDSAGNHDWPDAPWPGSVYDYENWPPDGYSSEQVVQISIRFCDAGSTYAMCEPNLPKESWVNSGWDGYSAVYYCIKGPCRSHQVQAPNWPGYCLNCGTNKNQIF